LPVSGDYLVVVGAAQGTANYRLKITIENDPERIARQAQSAGDQDVCTFIAEMAYRDKEKELFSDFNAEIKLNGGKALLDKLGISEEDQQRSSWDYATSVDVNNDGIEELRFQYWAGSAHCEHNEFFMKNINGEYASNILDPMMHEGGWLCSGNGLRFLRYKNTNYLLHVSVHRFVPKEITVYLFTKALNLELKCGIEIYSNEVEAKGDCSEPICGVVKKWIEGSLQPEAWVPIHGVEQPIENLEVVPIDWDSLKPWMKDGKFFFIDVDNDGINEVLVKKKGPPADRLVYSILKNQDGIYRAIIPAQIWPNYETMGPGTSSDKFLWEDNLFFEAAEGKNYLITLHFDDALASGKFSMPYKLDIFLLEKDKLAKIGTVNATFLKSGRFTKKD
jgi:hypothetical protein